MLELNAQVQGAFVKYLLLLTAGWVSFLILGTAQADQSTACVNGGQIRVLELDYAVEGQKLPCQVIYKKGFESEVLWKASGQAGFCEAKLAEFLEKQKEWGWRCTVMDMSVLGEIKNN